MTDPAAQQPEAEPTAAELWDAAEPGRLSKGVYSVYKTEDGGLHVSYRPDGAAEDQHLPIPGRMVAMMVAAAEGKGPLGRIRAMVAGTGS